MNLLETYIFGRIVRMFFASLVPVLAIIWITQVLGRINLVTDSGQSIGSFALLATYLLPTLIPIVMPFAITIGVTQTLQTMNTDSEFAVIDAAGANRSVLYKPAPILAAVVCVYIVLGVLYESYIHPVTILSTLPTASVGALVTLILFGYQLDIIAIIGIILLIGIVKKNAIMMIDFALDAERNEGKPAQEAIFQACLLRFRPILMTTMAAILGAVPLMLGSGAGSELRHPLGFAIVGGLIVSQVLTLFTTPVIYLYFDRLAQRFGGKPSHQAPR